MTPLSTYTGEEKHRHCGVIMSGMKSVTSLGNSLTLQFHSDGNDNGNASGAGFQLSKPFKGFWVRFAGT